MRDPDQDRRPPASQARGEDASALVRDAFAELMTPPRASAAGARRRPLRAERRERA